MAATALKGLFSKLCRIKKSPNSSPYLVRVRPSSSPPSGGASPRTSSTSSTCLLQGDDGKISTNEVQTTGSAIGGMTEKTKPDAQCIQFKSTTQEASTPTRAEDEEDEDLKKAFAVYDQNGDGSSQPIDELYHVLRLVVVPVGKQGDVVTLAQCPNMIRVLDRDGDGAVSFKEFAAMVGSVPVAVF